MPTSKRWLRPHAALGWLALLAATFLGGCGPGVGGTGTGDTAAALVHFGASPAALCSSELAALVSCRQDGTTATSVPASAPVLLADTTARVRVRLQDDTVELVDACLPLEFRGQWGVVSGQDARFYGHADPDAAPSPATLEAQATGTGVLLTLRDGGGRVLLGPVAVNVVAAPPVPEACP
jgi:hypothetical protein